MNRNILIISEAETFTVKGLEMKLKAINVDSVYCAPRLRDLEKLRKPVGLVIFYTDDSIDSQSEILVFLKDHLPEGDIQMIVIGAESEYDVLKKYILPESILSFYERPLNMPALLDEVELYFDEESEHARRKSILIIDDDASYMNMVCGWLDDRYRISMVSSGMQGITWLARNKADLILLDYEMPVTSGAQVLEMLRSEPSTEHIPVMFLTGKNDRQSIMNVLALKPADYLLKTIDRQGLRDKIDEFFIKQLAT